MRLQSKMELAGLAALAYVPFLLSSPGQVSADSKQDLYLDPGRFLARAADLWDPHVGAGTVPHQNLGYLFPTGPWFWVMDQLGVPDWVAQRLWLGTIVLAAALGARWLFRQLGTGPAGALAGAVVYALTPYQLAFTARISVLLLPWAALPWLVGLTMRATRTRSWRPAALLALVLLAAGGVNASSLLLVAVAPLLWVVLELWHGADRGQVLRAAGRLALLGAALCAWWLVGLRVQGAYGLPVLQLTENVRTVAEASNPSDVLRGLGNWFFYGRDRTGYSLDQAADYAGASRLVVALSYAVPAAAVGAAFLLRWSYRRYFALLVAVGTVIGVGAWPYDDPSPYGSLWKTVTSETSLGLALRNSPRVVPVIVLGFAGLLAAAVAAVPRGWWQRAAAGGVAGLAALALLPVAQHGFLTDGMLRPEEIPDHWQEAAAAIDAGDAGTRVLEVPGVSFAAYRWGTTVDPITPGLVDRPYLAREVLPQGTAPTANLLDALDRRMQLGTFEPASLAPIARLLAAGTISLRADLEQAGRFDTPDPAPLWRALRSAPGLEPPRTFGPPGGDGSDSSVPSVALFDVARPVPIVRTAPAASPVVLAGDGDGFVDVAAAGLLDGSGLVLPAAPLDDAALDAAVDAGAHLMLTDTYRRRIQTWFYSLRVTRGPTEQAGETAPDPTGYDVRLDPYPGATDADRTVVEQDGGRVTATGGGGPEHPEDRAARAVDDDVSTAWRVGGPDPRGQSLTVVPDRPVRAGEVRLVQPVAPAGAPALARVRVEVPGTPPVEVDLGDESRTPSGQPVAVPTGVVERVRVVVLETTPPAPLDPAARVGLAEVRIGTLRIAETVRPPVSLLSRVGDRSAGLGLDVVLTRLREVHDEGHLPDETHLERTLDLPTRRAFALRGTARPATPEPAGGTGELLAGGDCRLDLVVLDGAPLAVRLVPGGEALGVEACEPVVLDAGRHRLSTAPGRSVGIDIDRIVLSSGPDGGPAAVAPRDAAAGDTGTTATVQRERSDTIEVSVRSDGSPFWLVLGQSASEGWSVASDGAAVGERQLANGYANAWLITPERAGTMDVELRWGPQRWLWLGVAVSAVGLAAALGVLWRTRRAAALPTAVLADLPALRLWSPSALRRPLVAVGSAALVGLVGLLVAPPDVAGLAAVAMAVAWLVPHGQWLLAAAAPAALLASRAGARPSLAWLVVLLLAADALARPASEEGPVRSSG